MKIILSDRFSNKPLYIQVAAILRGDILSGEIPNGTRLSGRQIAEKYNVSKKTVSDALDILESEGLIITKAKSGSIVNRCCWIPIIDGAIQEWSSYINLGNHISNKEEIYSSVRRMSSDPKARLSGSAIHKDFNYSKPVKIALQNVLKRIDSTNEFNSINTMGLPALRETLAKHMERFGISCNAENIMITNNPIESVSIIINSLMRRGMKVFHETPCILNSCTFEQTMGLNICQIPIDNKGFDTEKFVDNIRKVSGDAILYINPVNQYPTGFSLSKKRRDTLLTACINRDIPIIENDMLRDYYIDNPHPKPMKSFDKSGQIVYIGSLLNTWVNIQVSWIVAEPIVLKKLCDVKAQYSIITNTLTQLTADEMIRSGAYYDYLNEYRPIFKDRLYIVRNLFEKYFKDIAQWNTDNNIYYQYLKFKEPINTFHVLKHLEDIAIHSGFFFDKTDFSHFYINPFIDTIENIDYGLKRIATTIKDIYNL